MGSLTLNGILEGRATRTNWTQLRQFDSRSRHNFGLKSIKLQQLPKGAPADVQLAQILSAGSLHDQALHLIGDIQSHIVQVRPA